MAMKPLADDLQLAFPCQGLAAFFSASKEPVCPYNLYSFYMNGARMSITEAGFWFIPDSGGLVRFIFIGYDELRGAIDPIRSGHFSHGDQELFRPLIDSLRYHDEYLLFADYQSYIDCQEQVGKIYQDKKRWTRMSILSVASIGKFSSDHSSNDYCRKIWQVRPFPVELKWRRIPEGGIVFPKLKSRK